MSAAIVGAAGGAVQNVFVYVKDGLDPLYTFDVPTDAVDARSEGLPATRRASLGVRVGQPIDIVNSDARCTTCTRCRWPTRSSTRASRCKGFRMTKTFTAPEVMVRFKCNVHGWMRAYVGVMAHPYFAVTDADGAFKITNLPPGTYTIGALAREVRRAGAEGDDRGEAGRDVVARPTPRSKRGLAL